MAHVIKFPCGGACLLISDIVTTTIHTDKHTTTTCNKNRLTEFRFNVPHYKILVGHFEDAVTRNAYFTVQQPMFTVHGYKPHTN